MIYQPRSQRTPGNTQKCGASTCTTNCTDMRSVGEIYTDENMSFNNRDPIIGVKKGFRNNMILTTVM